MGSELMTQTKTAFQVRAVLATSTVLLIWYGHYAGSFQLFAGLDGSAAAGFLYALFIVLGMLAAIVNVRGSTLTTLRQRVLVYTGSWLLAVIAYYGGSFVVTGAWQPEPLVLRVGLPRYAAYIVPLVFLATPWRNSMDAKAREGEGGTAWLAIAGGLQGGSLLLYLLAPRDFGIDAEVWRLTLGAFGLVIPAAIYGEASLVMWGGGTRNLAAVASLVMSILCGAFLVGVR